MVSKNSAIDPTQAGRPGSRREIVLGVSGLVLVMLLGMLDSSVVATALPTIVGELGDVDHLAWVVTAYMLGTAASTQVWGKLGDIYGRKATFLIGIALFLVASAAAGASEDMTQLIAFRAVQGVAAGGLMVNSLAIVADLVPPAERGRYLGLMTAAMPVAMICGPLLGGVVTDGLGWRWAFFINLPLGGAALVVCAVALRIPHHRRSHRIDLAGASLLAAALVGLTLLVTWGGARYEWLSPSIGVLAAITVLAAVGFVWAERHASEPVLPLSLFAIRNFSLVAVLGFAVGVIMYGAVTFLPQYLQNVQHASATSSGLLLLPFMLGMVAASLATGQLISRTGRYRLFAIAGAAALAVASALLTQLHVDSGHLTTSLELVLLGLGMGMLMQPVMTLSQNSVPFHHLGAAMGAANLSRTIGGSLGTAVLGAVFIDRIRASLTAGSPPADWHSLSSTGGNLSPDQVARLPEPIRQAFVDGITSGITQLFWWALALALVSAVLAALIRNPREADSSAATGSEA